jgi:rhomboid protease GluP
VDLSYALSWMVGLSAVFGLATSLRQLHMGIRGWFFVNAALLSVLGLGVFVAWDDIGYLAALLWLAFVVFPSVATRRRNDAVECHRLDDAAHWARIAGVLHPFDGHYAQALFLACENHLEHGRPDVAKGVIYPLLGKPLWANRVKMELLRIDGRWSEIAAHAKSQPAGARELQLAPLYLQAFGELGDLESMWVMYGQVPPALARQPALELQMAAYTGLSDLADLLISRNLPTVPRARTDPFRAVQTRTIIPAGEAAQRGELSSAVREAIAEFERNVRAAKSSILRRIEPRRAWATLTILTVLVGVFLVGLPRGSTDPDNLIQLGALVLPSELADGGIAWRIVAAGFLHLGATHLIMNCLGLWVLGKQIEQLLGGLVTLAIFLVSSVGSFGFAAAYVHATLAEPRVFLGASSGVLGLVGALGAFFATGYVTYRQRALRSNMFVVLAVVLSQFVFDWFTPAVSSMLHLTGLLIGAVMAIPFSITTWRRQSESVTSM